jgi:hypothetical protein
MMIAGVKLASVRIGRRAALQKRRFASHIDVRAFRVDNRLRMA